MNEFLNVKVSFKYKVFLLSFFVFLLLFPIFVTAQSSNSEVKNKSFFITLLFDKSRSLDIEDGNTQYALPAAKYLVEFIDIYRQKTGIDIRFEFISFGELVEEVEKLNSISKENILKEIRFGKTLKTDFIPPFRKSMHLFASSMKSKCLIFLFTDGVPDLQDSSENKVLNYFNTSGIKEDIRLLTDIMNVNIEIIGFNDRWYGSNVTRDKNPYFIKKIWDSLLEGNPGYFHSIGNEMLDPMKVVHEILEKFLYGQSFEWTELKKGEFVVDIEPFLEWAVLTIIKDGQEDTATVKNSKGETLSSDVKEKNGHYLIYYLNPTFDEKLIVKHIKDEKVWYKINKRYPEVRFELGKMTSNRHKGLPLFSSREKLELSCSIFRGDSLIKNKDINLKLDGRNMKYDGNGIYSQKISITPSTEVKIINLPTEALWENKNIPLNGLDNIKFAVDKISPVMKTEKEIEGKTGFNFYFWIPVVVVLLIFSYFVYKFRKGKHSFSRRNLNKNINEIKILFSEKRKKILYILNKRTDKSIMEAIDILKNSWVLFDDIEMSLADKFDSIPGIYKKLIETMKYANYDDEKIFEYIIRTTRDAPIIFLDGFSKYLNDIRWKDWSFGDIIKDIYLLIERPTPPRRILNSIIRKLKDKDLKEVLKLMKDTYDLSLEHSEYTLAEILKNFVNAYDRVREKDEIGRIGYEMFYSLENLYELIDHSPYHDELIEMPEIPEGAIRSWEMTSELCKLDTLNVEPDDVFNILKKRLKECLNILGPEKQIAFKLLNKWLAELKNVPSQPVKLTFEFLPEIHIDKDRLENDWSFFSIKIINCSRGNAYNFNVKLEGEENNPIDSYTIHKIIAGESAITKLFKVYESIDNVSITYKFEGQCDSESRGYKISYGTIPIKIEANEKKYKLKSKSFIYNTPYIDNSFIFVNRTEALKKLEESTLHNERSDIFNIFGIRGIGKTSLIRRFRDSYAKNENIKDTYINIANYTIDKDIQTEENFLGYLARNIVSKYENIPIKETSLNGEGWEINEFKEFIFDLMKMQYHGHKHIIFLDDSDIFEEMDKSGKCLHLDLLKLLKFLHELIIDLDKERGHMYVIFSGHKDVLGNQWSKVECWPSKKNINLKLLEKDEVLEIAAEGGLLLNLLSLRYLMNLTGGHPELVQLICALIKKERPKDVLQFSQSVSMKIISNVVFKICHDAQSKGSFQYIIGYSLPRNLHNELLKALRNMDKITLEFKKELLDLNNLTKLIENGFLGFNNNNNAIVRIGILKLLPDDFIIVGEDRYDSHV